MLTSFFAFPINIILIISLIFILFIIKSIPVLTFLWNKITSFKSIFYSIFFFFLIILLIQLCRTFLPFTLQPTHFIYRLGLSRFYGSPLLIFSTFCLLLILMAYHSTLWKKKRTYKLFFHYFFSLGAILVITSLFLGSADREEYKIFIQPQLKNSYAYTEQQEVVVLPFALQLERIDISRYHSGKTKQSTAYFNLFDKHSTCQLKTSVNRPSHYNEHDFYLYNYDHYNRNKPQYATLLLVKDPWQKVTIVGIILLFIASFMLIFSVKKGINDVN